MSNENPQIELFAYMMACEKMVNMISVIDQTMEFMQEYKIKPDDPVKKALNPLIEKMKNWIEKGS